MLTQRKENLLKVIIGEYIVTGVPVGSEAVVRRHQLGISPATVRNEMAQLEEEGYLRHPHTSAGRIPTDRGYRYYVESLMEGVELPLPEQRLIRHQFHQLGREVEQWIHLAAGVLSRMVRNAVIVTLPKAVESRFKHLDLVSLQDFLALLILVLSEAKLKRQMVTLKESASQDELFAIANRMNATYTGLTSFQISRKEDEFSSIEKQIRQVLIQMMEAEKEEEYEEPCLDGLHYFLRQPEFAFESWGLEVLELLGERGSLKRVLPRALAEDGVLVFIGEENRQDILHDFSVVVSRYGIPGEIGGALAVVGPIRMPYARTISSVRYLASVMNEIVGYLYG